MKRLSPLRIVQLVAALLAVFNGIAVVMQYQRTASGTPILPFDDSYIHYQYAWQAAHGHLMQYTPGAAPSTGGTSLLYMLLIAGGFLFNLSRDSMVWAVLVANQVLFVVATLLLMATAAALADKTQGDQPVIPAWGAGAIAGFLFAGGSWTGVAYLGGMETGLAVTLLVGMLWAVWRDRPALAAGLAALATLTRPELLLIGMAWLIAGLLIPTKQKRWRWTLWGLLPLAAFGLGMLINYVFTGQAGSAALSAKSWLTVIPFSFWQVVDQIARTFGQLVLLFVGPSGRHWHTFPLTLIGAGLGFWLVWQSGDGNQRRIVVLSALWALLHLGATASLQTATWQHFRYELPVYPVLLIPLAMALSWIADQIAKAIEGGYPLVRGVMVGGLLVWLAYAGGALWPDIRAESTKHAVQHIPMAEWIAGHTPPDATIAVYDAGIIAYYGQRPIFDMVGLATPGEAEISRNGPGARYEALTKAQPDYLAIYPDLTTASSPLRFDDADLRYVFDAADDLGTQVIAPGLWEGTEAANHPWQPNIVAGLEGWQQIAYLNVADLPSEAAYGYTWWNVGRPDGFPSLALDVTCRADPGIRLADGGRSLTGGERFTLPTTPDQSLRLVARLHQMTDMALAVTVDGQAAGEWRLPAAPGEWIEAAFDVPGDLIQTDHIQVELSIIEPAADKKYQPFAYWAYQPGDPQVRIFDTATIDATFSEVIRLVGYDLPADSFSPGDVLSLTLYWQMEERLPGPVDYKVFVHLTDPQRADSIEGVAAQADGEPERGAHPFWTWQAGEAASQSIQMALPADIAPGEYVLLMGIYDEATFARLPISGATDFGGQRLNLGTITIRGSGS